MNEIINVNYNNEQPTVSAREIKKALDMCRDFKEFFIQVSKYKVDFEFDELRILCDLVREYIPIYGVDAIVYLCDSIVSESILPCKSKEIINLKEKEMKKQIINNFDNIFPEYTLLGTEWKVDKIGRIDLYAKFRKTPVIIELKTGKNNPNSQLIAYGSAFKNPILISITEEEVPLERKLNNIIYYTLDEIKDNIPYWII